MECIILAGGKGTRMKHLTAGTPKPLLAVQGRPILEWSLMALRPVADRALIVVGYLKEQIEAYMRQQTLFTDYQCVEQTPAPLGTGHALLCCAPHLHGDDFLVINGDDLFSAAALARLAAARYGILTLPRDDGSKYGVVVTDDQGRMVRLHEKPAPGTYPPPVQVSIGG